LNSCRPSDAIVREIEYHDRLYSGFAQSHFAKPAVRALRNHLVSNILKLCAAGPASRVLSLGCGIGDTELIMAAHVAEIVGVDLSPAAICQAQKDTAQAHIRNATFTHGTLESAQLEPASFDLIIAIFFLHHLSEADLPAIAIQIRHLLRPGGRFYSLDPNRYRLSGAIGSLLVPKLMARYQSPNERPLVPSKTAAVFTEAGLETSYSHYDFISTPLAGLFPAWSAGYHAARLIDEPLIRIPGLRQVASNFQVISRRVLS
jgi:SAM-dependent methyltransferase